MNKEKISIIIPAYNVEKYIEKCLDSVITQTYKELDIIIVDDGSKDATGNIADSYAKKDPRIHVIHQANGGLPHARNTGLKYAEGEYIMFLDSDDWLEPMCCEIAICEIQNKKADLLFFEYYKEFRNKTVQVKTYPKEHMMYYKNGLKEFSLYDMRTITAWGKIYSSKIISNCKYNEILRTAEDVEFNYRVYGKVSKAIYIQKPLLHYRILEQSAIHGYDPQIENKLIPALEIISKWALSGENYKVEAYYSFAAIALLLVWQNGICLNKNLGFMQKRNAIANLKKNIYFHDLYHNIKCVKIPKSRKIFIEFGKINLNFLIIWIISIKQWKEKRN